MASQRATKLRSGVVAVEPHRGQGFDNEAEMSEGELEHVSFLSGIREWIERD